VTTRASQIVDNLQNVEFLEKARKFSDPNKKLIEDENTEKDFWVVSNQDGEVKACSIESQGYMEPEDILMEYKEQHELAIGEELIVYKVENELEQEKLETGKRQAIMNSSPTLEGEPIVNPYIPYKDKNHAGRLFECKTDKGEVRRNMGGKWEVVDVEGKAKIPRTFLHSLRKEKTKRDWKQEQTKK